MSLSKNVIKIVSAVFTAVIFITAASLLCKPSALDDIVAITVTPSRTVLDSADKMTTYRFDEQTQSYISKSYYNIYDYDNITLTVDYGSYQKDYSGTEIAKLTAQIGTPFIISDGQSDSAWGYGTHTVSYLLGTHTASAVFTVVKSRIESVSIQPQYDINVIYNVDGSYKTVRDAEGNLSQRFIYGLDGFDYAVTLGYTDGSEISCYAADLKYKTGYNAVFSQEDKQLSVGENTGYYTVGGVTASFTFNVIENPIESISLYMTDGADTLYSGSDGYYDERSDGSKFYRFIYDRTKLRAKVSYTDGTSADYALGELCATLHRTLKLNDMQAVSPWEAGTVTFPAYISGITTSLTLEIIGALPVTDAKATGNEGHSVTIGWSDVSCDGYIIEMYTKDGWTELDRLPSGTVSYKADGLTDVTGYKFAVSSYYVNPKTGQEVVTDRCIVPVTTGLSALSGLTATNVTSGSVVLSWSSGSSADGYIIEQYKDGKWVRISTITSNSTVSRTVTGLTQGTLCKFRIRAYKTTDSGNIYSGYSYINAYTLPANVSGFKLTKRTSSAITLGWSKNANATGYILEQYKSGKWVRISTITSNSTVSRTVTGLSQGTLSKFRIRAYKTTDSGNIYSGYSYVNAYTLPANVSGFKLTKRTSSAITLGWSKNANATGYILEQYKSGKWMRISTITSNSTVSRTVTGLSQGTLCKFRIRAYKTTDSGNIYSGYSYVNAYTLPANVSGFKLTKRTSSAITLGWSKNANATGYILEQYKSGKWVRISTITSNSTVSRTVTGLTQGTLCKFRIRAYKTTDSGNIYSGYSYANAYMLPANVSGFKLTKRTSSAITLGWSKNANATGYILEQYKSGRWVRISTITSNSTISRKVTGLSHGKSYKFRIRTYKTTSAGNIYSGYTTITASTL